jgi:hypothetical protein
MTNRVSYFSPPLTHANSYWSEGTQWCPVFHLYSLIQTGLEGISCHLLCPFLSTCKGDKRPYFKILNSRPAMFVGEKEGRTHVLRGPF